MPVTRISEKLSVSSQPNAQELSVLDRSGFKTLINNRPDNESADQPGNQAECDAAHQCDLSYAYIPVTMNTITEADVRAFQAAVRRSDGPVLAHCKTGTRSLSLHLIGEVLDGRMSVEDVVRCCHVNWAAVACLTVWA